MIEPKDLLNVAKFLKDCREEAHIRSVVNRSYYAVFLHVRGQLKAKGVSIPRDVSTHKFVIECFGKSKTRPKGGTSQQVDYKLLGQIWQRLRTLFADRINADYELSLKFPHSYSSDSIRRAETTISDVTGLQGSPTEVHLIRVAQTHVARC